MKSLIKKLLVPDGAKEIEAIDTWEVKWTSRNGAYHSNAEPEIEVFHTEQEARDFYRAIKDAHKLLRNTGEGTEVWMRKRIYGGIK